MAYKPKYASAGGRAARQEPQAPSPKKGKGGKVLSVLLAIVTIPTALAASALLLRFMLLHVGRAKQSTSAAAELGIYDTFRTNEEIYESEAMLRLRAAAQSAEAETTVPTVTEAQVIHQHYTLSEDTVVPPAPDEDLYGSSSNPVILSQILEDADFLLQGEKTYFNPEGTRYEAENIVRYYLDDSIFAITWKEVHDGSVYTFSEIKVGDASQFRRHLAGGEYGSEMQYLTTEMAQSVNAVVASAGDFYRFRDFGAVVYEGVARRVEGTYAETCYIDRNGNMHFTYGGEVLTVEDVQAYVDQNDISFSLAFGPILVDNGQVVEHTWYGVGEIDEGYARAALCQMGQLHYLLVTANTQGNYQEIPTVATFSQVIASTGCVNAYCLDGGQTATIVMGGELINRPVYGQQRKISDIIYFATAVPEEG